MRTPTPSKSSRAQRGALCLFLLCCLTHAFAPLAAAKAVLDFDGDGRTDYAVIRDGALSQNIPTSWVDWHILHSSGSSVSRRFGTSTWSLPVEAPQPEDYDGDGKTDFALFRRGVENVSSPSLLYVASRTNTFQSQDLPGLWWPNMTQDYDGDGRADPAQSFVDNNQRLIWRIISSETGEMRELHFGNRWDNPIRGDFDGDGRADIAVYRNSQGNPANTFIVHRSSDNTVQFTVFGNSTTDSVISADFDGDRKTDYAVWRNRNLSVPVRDWYWIESSTGALRSHSFGLFERYEIAAPGDYDGDGRTDHAVARNVTDPSSNAGVLLFYVQRSTGGLTITHWGNGWDYPLAQMYAH